jgi:hypothetical protein
MKKLFVTLYLMGFISFVHSSLHSESLGYRYLITCSLSAQIPADGLVAWYPFNVNANDESGNGNNGVNSGATLTVDRNGDQNKAYSFNSQGGIVFSPVLNVTEYSASFRKIRKLFDFINESSDSKFKDFFGELSDKITADSHDLAKEISIRIEVPNKGALWISSVVESGVDMTSSLYLMEIYDYDVNEFKKSPPSKNFISKESPSKNGIGCGVAHYQKFWFDPEVLKKKGTREKKGEKEEVFVYPNSYDFIPEQFIRLFNEIGPLHSGKIPRKIKLILDRPEESELPEKFIEAYTTMIEKTGMPANEGYFKDVSKKLYTSDTIKCIYEFNKSLIEIYKKE